MYAGRVACCPLVSHGDYAFGTGGQTDRYIALSAMDAASVLMVCWFATRRLSVTFQRRCQDGDETVVDVVDGRIGRSSTCCARERRLVVDPDGYLERSSCRLDRRRGEDGGGVEGKSSWSDRACYRRDERSTSQHDRLRLQDGAAWPQALQGSQRRKL